MSTPGYYRILHNIIRAYLSNNRLMLVSGIPELRTAIVKFHKHFDSLTLNSDDVLVAPGSKELIFLLLNVFDGGWILSLKVVACGQIFCSIG